MESVLHDADNSFHPSNLPAQPPQKIIAFTNENPNLDSHILTPSKIFRISSASCCACTTPPKTFCIFEDLHITEKARNENLLSQMHESYGQTRRSVAKFAYSDRNKPKTTFFS